MRTVKLLGLLLIFQLVTACGTATVEPEITQKASFASPTAPKPATHPEIISTPKGAANPASPAKTDFASSSPIEFKGDLLGWRRMGPEGIYAVFPFQPGTMSPLSVGSAELESTRPEDALDLLFSHNRDQIVFVTANQDGALELWATDHRLLNPALLWHDVSRWFGSIARNTNEVTLRWGPAENSVLITSQQDETKSAVYSFSEQELYTWNGDCGHIVRSPESELLALACSGTDGYLISEVDGAIHLVDGLQDGGQAVDWLFSPNGTASVYVSQLDELIYLAPSGEEKSLPVSPSYSFLGRTHKASIQWYVEGEQILVYGFPEREDDCPRLPDRGMPQSCWLLLDLKKEAVIWKLDQSKIEAAGLNWDNLYTSYEVAVSPDGRHIALILIDQPIRNLIIVSVETGEVTVIGNYEYEKLNWRAASGN